MAQKRGIRLKSGRKPRRKNKMKQLLDHILSSLTPEGSYQIAEEVNDDRFDYIISLDPENMGMIIGKGGRTIRAIRNLLKIRATLEKKLVNVTIAENSPSKTE